MAGVLQTAPPEQSARAELTAICDFVALRDRAGPYIKRIARWRQNLRPGTTITSEWSIPSVPTSRETALARNLV
jgi:hypothetical protein